MQYSVFCLFSIITAQASGLGVFVLGQMSPGFTSESGKEQKILALIIFAV